MSSTLETLLFHCIAQFHPLVKVYYLVNYVQNKGFIYVLLSYNHVVNKPNSVTYGGKIGGARPRRRRPPFLRGLDRGKSLG